MANSTLEKGKNRASPEEVEHQDRIQAVEEDAASASDSDSSDSDSESDSDNSGSSSVSDEDVSQEFLDSLLERARNNMTAKAQLTTSSVTDEEEVIHLGSGDDLIDLPALDPGKLPAPYIDLTENVGAGPSKARIPVRDLDVEQAEKATSSMIPAAPAPPPSARPKDKSLTKQEQKALKTKTAGKSWFELPAPAEADLPKLYREVEAMRLRNQLDPKRFYRKDEGEGKGIKGLPKYFAIGTIVPDATPFASSSPANLSRSQRKRTLVDELVDDAEAKSYAKKKFKDLQSARGARGRGTLAKRREARKPKW